MAGRTVSVTLQAQISGYLASMQRASAATSSFASKASAGIAKHEQGINNLSRASGLVGGVLAAGFITAAGAAANFDSAMSSVAATGADAKQNLSALRDAAIKAGADTKFSATEAAGGLEALAKAGVSAKDSLSGGLSGALNLAAAGNLDVAGSAEAAASAMNQFGLAGADIPHIADLLAQAAGTAQGEVSDMAAALNQSGQIASQFGLSIDETAQALALFAKNGLVGSDAGTSFKTMLSSLYAPVGAAAKTLDKLGVSAYDASGSLKPIGAVADDLKGKLDQLSEGDRNKALTNIFGSDAIRAAVPLLKDGSAGLGNMATEFGKFGSAAGVAATKMDNLKGDLEQLKGSLETTLIKTGSGANQALRDMTQDATGLVNGIGNLPAPLLKTGLGITAVGAASLLSVAGLGRLAVNTVQTRQAMRDLAAESPRLAKGLQAASKAAGLAVVGFVALEVGLAGVGAVSRHFRANFVADIEASNKALVDLAASGSAANLNKLFRFDAPGFGKTITGVDSLGSALQRVKQNSALDQLRNQIDKVTGTTGILHSVQIEFQQLDASMVALGSAGHADQAAASFKQVADAAKLQGLSLDQVVGLFPQYAQAIRDAAASNQFTITSTQELVDWMGGKAPAGFKAAADASGTAGAAIGNLPGVINPTTKSLEDLVTAAHNAANALLAISGGEIGMEAAIDAASASLKKNGKTLDVHTAKGRENQSALNAIVSTTNTYTESLAANHASAVKIVNANERGRKSFIKLAEGMNVSHGDAVRLANSLFKIPKSVKSQVAVPGAKLSKKEADDVNTAMKNIPKEKRPAIVVIAQTKGAKAAQAAIDAVHGKNVNVTVTHTIYEKHVSVSGQGTGGGRATGGLISGPGTGTSDSIPAMLSDGEVVIKAASVKSIGAERLLYANAYGELPKFAQGGLVGYATGGQVNANWIQSLIRAIENPLGLVASAAKSVAAWTAKGKAGADKLADAQQKLRDQVQAVADSARQVAETFRNQFAGQGTDPFAWLTTMRAGAADISAFNSQLGKLRKGGLSETLIQQLIGMGAGSGGTAAGGILAGGPNLVKALNSASAGLQTAADKLGYLGATGKGRYAYGGPVTGAGTATSDSVPIMASTGEWVVPAHAVPANRPALEAMTYGRTVVSHNFARGYAYGGMVQRSNVDMGVVRAALTGMRIAGEMRIHQDRGWIEGVVVDVMDHETGRAVGAF